MIVTLSRLLSQGYTHVEAQNAMSRAASDALRSGYKVTRVSTVATDDKQRITKTLTEVRIS